MILYLKKNFFQPLIWFYKDINLREYVAIKILNLKINEKKKTLSIEIAYC